MTLLLLLALGAAPTAPADVYSLKPDAFVDTAKRDLATMKIFVSGMQTVTTRVQENRALFAVKADAVYSPEQKRTLLSTWGALFSYFSATEALREKYWDFIKLPPTDPRHAWGFVLTHTALTALLAYGMSFADLALNNRQLETLFDEPSGEFGVPPNAFADFKARAIHVTTSTQLVTGDAYSSVVLPVLKVSKALDEPNVQWAWQEMKRDSKTAKDALGKQGVKLFVGNAADILKDSTATAIFPAQKTFSEWAGDTRVARIGKPLLTREVMEKSVLPRLQSGDILVARQNWFLSNIALPGFWPHALLYVGTPTDLTVIDADPEVQAWAKKQPEKAANLSELLAKRHAAKWKAYQGPDFQGHSPVRVIESISEGVSFTAIEHAFGVDYLAAMRPRLKLVEKAQAIERAFKYQGRPYDFDFDFFSDATLVCTELVFKSYQASSEMHGLSFELVDVAGRRTLPANELVKAFDAQADKEDRQLDFVLFVDAVEKTGQTVDADAKAFRSSWQRVKWDVAQK